MSVAEAVRVEEVAWTPAVSDDAPVGRVLLVGGDRSSVEAAWARLARHGHSVGVVPTGAAASLSLGMFSPDVLVVDARVPDGPAVAALRRLRTLTDAPTILTGLVGHELDRVLALDAGFDDVVPAPASPAELAARVRAILRRTCRPTTVRGDSVEVGRIAIDIAAHRVWSSGRPVVLTALEFRLLAYFCAHSGEALTREELLARVWGYTVGCGSTVTVHVRRLREKIEPDPAKPTMICTVWGVGYRFEEG